MDTPEKPRSGWSEIIGSSAIMSLALLGDALLYAVLPVYASDFGLTLPWVGVMLSANRFIRVFAYGWIARLTQHYGPRNMCIAAACMAAFSTLLYGIGSGVVIMLGARVLWGLTYGTLVLATLAYAVTNRARAGTRIGVSRAIQRIGPIFALIGGAWLVSTLGPRQTFVALAVLTALAIPLAMRLPKAKLAKAAKTPSGRLTRPAPIDVIFFLQGYGVDGVFAMTITLILARDGALAAAVMGGSALLAMRHFGEAIAAPLFGWMADHFGARKVFVGATLLTTLGFVLVATGLTVTGALIMLIFRGALAALGPAVIAQALPQEQDVLAPLARMQAWRDFGAACGPLATGFALVALSPEWQHALVALAMAGGVAFWLKSSRISS